MLNFSVSFLGREDKELAERLATERAGILAWLVRGAVEWFTGGLQDPPEVLAATEDYRKEADVVGEFLVDCCVIGSASYHVQAGAFYEAFTDWYKREHGGEPLSGVKFGHRIMQDFQRYPDPSNRRWYKGVGLRTE